MLFRSKSKHYPRLTITDQNAQIIIEATVHGLKKEDIKIDIEYWKNHDPKVNVDETGQIIISASHAKRFDGERVLEEIRKSNFSRTIYFSEKLCDIFNMTAKVEDGILILTIPKFERQPKDRFDKVETKRVSVAIE